MMAAVLGGCVVIARNGWVLLHSNPSDKGFYHPRNVTVGALVLCVGVLGAGAAVWAMKGGAA